MGKSFVVREYDTITCNKNYSDSPNFKYIDEKYFNELEQFIKEYSSSEENADILEFMKIGYKRSVGNTITFNNNVGIIELPSGFQIEILPKIDLGEKEDDYSKTKHVFLNMLCCLKEFEGKALNNASLNADKMNLYEVFINMYIQEARNLVKHGIKSGYIQNEDNLRFYKGKLQVSQHIKSNLVHKERFYMQFDEYQVNRAENRLVKTTLLKLQKITNSTENAKEIRQLLLAFEMVDVSKNIDKDFACVSLGRDTKDYEKLIQWADIFLRNKSFTTFSGKNSGTALLFPMEQVFEAFVAKWVKRIFAECSDNEARVSAQDRGYYLFDTPRKFRLRPDIVSRRRDYPIIIMDTKWKRLNTNASANYGISQADMYQMYAYSKKYHTSEIWLLYPFHEEVRGLDNISFIAERGEELKVNVHVNFIDLNNYKNCIYQLYSNIYENKAML
ncbi:MAG: restriction endonuclease [Pseudobutyrivibrio ruminis]|uniref:Restriction endonuclease n=1 Tax=Pseudobutyrivibrio ruminis TaxID=46206 RepID=A0A927UCR0_9FIRM|nr:restriction endonuclease [Pseudobutyrivibrio ruminis]